MAKRNERVKQVLLAVFFCLFTSSTASAQSGMVLWEQVQVMEIKNTALSENSQWTLLEVATTNEACIEAQRHLFEVRKNEYAALKEEFPKMEVWTTPYRAITVRSSLEPVLISNIFHCLPRTTDPRNK